MNKRIQSLIICGIIAANLTCETLYSFANEVEENIQISNEQNVDEKDLETESVVKEKIEDKNLESETIVEENSEISNEEKTEEKEIHSENIVENSKLKTSIKKNSKSKKVNPQAKNYNTKNSWYDPTIYNTVQNNGFVDTLYDGWGAYREVVFKNIEAYYNTMDIKINISSNTSLKDDYVTIEFYVNTNGTLSIVGTTEFDLSSTRNAEITSTVENYYFEDQPYIYMRLGVSDSIYDDYYSDVTTFKVKNPTYSLDGWIKEGENWYFYKDGKKQTGWLEINDKTYYLNESGIMVTGWKTINGIQYYFNSSGELQTNPPTKNGWLQESNKWYFYKDGVKQTGWILDGNTWYYCNENGEMHTGWLKLGTKWYYLSDSGKMVTGWKLVNGVYYYFNLNGSMKANEWLKDGAYWYYLSDSGKMVTGWKLINGVYYYFNSNGSMKANEWLKDGSYWYYLKSDGSMAANEIITISNEGNKFNASGVWLGTAKYSQGMYKVGVDIPAGKYVVIPNNSWDPIYFSVSTDIYANNIIFNEFITGKAFLEVKNGEYLKVERGYILPAEGYKIYTNDNAYTDGYYRVGIDIPAGQYRVVDGDGDGAYWSVQNYRGYLYDNDYFYGNSYVYIENGDILVLSNGAKIYK